VEKFQIPKGEFDVFSDLFSLIYEYKHIPGIKETGRSGYKNTDI